MANHISYADRPKVYVTRSIPEAGLKIMRNKCTVKEWASDEICPEDVLLDGVQDVQGLVCMLTDKIDVQVLDKAPHLRTICTLSVGYNHIDLKACSQRGITVGHTPNVSTESVAEMAIALMLSAGRRVLEGKKQVMTGGWTTWKPLWMLGKGIEGSTIGIVGCGRIGLAVAMKCKVFYPSSIAYYDVRRILLGEIVKKVWFTAEAEGLHRMEFLELLRKCDFVVCCCDLTPGSSKLFDDEAFKSMKPGAIFVNISRGEQVDHDALMKALQCGRLAAAGLDVTDPEPFPTDHPLNNMDNCVITPHLGSSTEDVRDRMSVLTAENIIAGLEGKTMPGAVKLPTEKSG